MENTFFDASNLDFLTLIKEIKTEAENLMPFDAAERGGVAMVDFLAHLLQVAKLSQIAVRWVRNDRDLEALVAETSNFLDRDNARKKVKQ